MSNGHYLSLFWFDSSWRHICCSRRHLEKLHEDDRSQHLTISDQILWLNLLQIFLTYNQLRLPVSVSRRTQWRDSTNSILHASSLTLV
jgi:hypothetical protein